MKPHAVLVAEAAREKVFGKRKRAGESVSDEIPEDQLWQESILDLHRVMSTAKSLFLILEHSSEKLLRVCVEIVCCPSTSVALWWPETWYADDEKREWFRKVVQEKALKCLARFRVETSYVEAGLDREDEDFNESSSKSLQGGRSRDSTGGTPGLLQPLAEESDSHGVDGTGSHRSDSDSSDDSGLCCDYDFGMVGMEYSSSRASAKNSSPKSRDSHKETMELHRRCFTLEQKNNSLEMEVRSLQILGAENEALKERLKDIECSKTLDAENGRREAESQHELLENSRNTISELEQQLCEIMEENATLKAAGKKGPGTNVTTHEVSSSVQQNNDLHGFATSCDTPELQEALTATRSEESRICTEHVVETREGSPRKLQVDASKEKHVLEINAIENSSCRGELEAELQMAIDSFEFERCRANDAQRTSDLSCAELALTKQQLSQAESEYNQKCSSYEEELANLYEELADMKLQLARLAELQLADGQNGIAEVFGAESLADKAAAVDEDEESATIKEDDTLEAPSNASQCLDARIDFNTGLANEDKEPGQREALESSGCGSTSVREETHEEGKHDDSREQLADMSRRIALMKDELRSAKKENVQLRNKNERMLAMLHDVKEQLKRMTELAKRKGCATLIEEAHINELLESEEFEWVNRLYQDALRRMEKHRKIEESFGILRNAHPRSRPETPLQRPSTTQGFVEKRYDRVVKKSYSCGALEKSFQEEFKASPRSSTAAPSLSSDSLGMEGGCHTSQSRVVQALADIKRGDSESLHAPASQGPTSKQSALLERKASGQLLKNMESCLGHGIPSPASADFGQNSDHPVVKLAKQSGLPQARRNKATISIEIPSGQSSAACFGGPPWHEKNFSAEKKPETPLLLEPMEDCAVECIAVPKMQALRPSPNNSFVRKMRASIYPGIRRTDVTCARSQSASFLYESSEPLFPGCSRPMASTFSLGQQRGTLAGIRDGSNSIRALLSQNEFQRFGRRAQPFNDARLSGAPEKPALSRSSWMFDGIGRKWLPSNTLS